VKSLGALVEICRLFDAELAGSEALRRFLQLGDELLEAERVEGPIASRVLGASQRDTSVTVAVSPPRESFTRIASPTLSADATRTIEPSGPVTIA
jgi:hypothetical protein